MPRYIDAEKLEKDGWWASRTYRQDATTTVYETKKMTDFPTADVVERKKGEWIDNKGLYQCSVCKHIWSELWWTSVCPIERMNKMMRYCPNCGAEMEGEDDV